MGSSKQHHLEKEKFTEVMLGIVHEQFEVFKYFELFKYSKVQQTWLYSKARTSALRLQSRFFYLLVEMIV